MLTDLVGTGWRLHVENLLYCSGFWCLQTQQARLQPPHDTLKVFTTTAGPLPGEQISPFSAQIPQRTTLYNSDFKQKRSNMKCYSSGCLRVIVTLHLKSAGRSFCGLMKPTLTHVLQENLMQSAENLQLGRRSVFQQDNEPKHKARRTTRLQNNNVKVLE